MQITATCHCGAIALEADAPDGLDKPIRCDCSFCVRRQAANVEVIAASIHITKGAEALTLYSFGSHTAKHYFCSVCGIYTHHFQRTNPLRGGVNLGCIAGAHPPDFDPIPWVDGINHPSDQS